MNVFPDIPRSPLPCIFPLLSSAAEARERSLILTPGKQTKVSPHRFIGWSGRQFIQSKSPPHCCRLNSAGSWSPRRLPRERPLIMLPLWEPSTRDTLSAEAGPCPGAPSRGAPRGSRLGAGSAFSMTAKAKAGWLGVLCVYVISLPSSENRWDANRFWTLYLLKSSLLRNAPEF